MPFTQGFIPDRNRIHQLEMLYSEFQRGLKNVLLQVTPINYTDLKALRIIRQTKIKIMELNLRSVKWARVAVKEAYAKAHDVAVMRLEVMGKKKDPDYNQMIHLKTIDKGIDIISSDLIRANNKILRQVKLYFVLIKKANQKLNQVSFQIQELDKGDAVRIDELLEAAREANLTLNQMNAVVLKQLENRIGEGNFIVIKGRNYQPKKYAEMIARTRLRAIQTQAVKNTSREYNSDLVAWSEHFMRVIDECEEFAGHIYSLSGKHSDFPKLTDEPPIHPQCEHHISPISEEYLVVRGIEVRGNKIIT